VSLLRSAVVILAAVVSLASAASAVPVTVPKALAPGESHRLVFVTSTGRDATSSDIADDDAFVTAVANAIPELASLGTTRAAIASTTAVDARDHTGTNPTTSSGVALYNTFGDQVAADNTSLWSGSLENGVVVNENGIDIPIVTRVWTGTDADGQGSADQELGAGAAAMTGFGISPTSTWIAANAQFATEVHSLYAMSDVLTVVPEPGSGLLLVLGLADVAGFRRRGGPARSSAGRRQRDRARQGRHDR